MTNPLDSKSSYFARIAADGKTPKLVQVELKTPIPADLVQKTLSQLNTTEDLSSRSIIQITQTGDTLTATVGEKTISLKASSLPIKDVKVTILPSFSSETTATRANYILSSYKQFFVGASTGWELCGRLVLATLAILCSGIILGGGYLAYQGLQSYSTHVRQKREELEALLGSRVPTGLDGLMATMQVLLRIAKHSHASDKLITSLDDAIQNTSSLQKYIQGSISKEDFVNEAMIGCRTAQKENPFILPCGFYFGEEYQPAILKIYQDGDNFIVEKEMLLAGGFQALDRVHAVQTFRFDQEEHVKLALGMLADLQHPTLLPSPILQEKKEQAALLGISLAPPPEAQAPTPQDLLMQTFMSCGATLASSETSKTPSQEPAHLLPLLFDGIPGAEEIGFDDKVMLLTHLAGESARSLLKYSSALSEEERDRYFSSLSLRLGDLKKRLNKIAPGAGDAIIQRIETHAARQKQKALLSRLHVQEEARIEAFQRDPSLKVPHISWTLPAVVETKSQADLPQAQGISSSTQVDLTKLQELCNKDSPSSEEASQILTHMQQMLQHGDTLLNRKSYAEARIFLSALLSATPASYDTFFENFTQEQLSQYSSQLTDTCKLLFEAKFRLGNMSCNAKELVGFCWVRCLLTKMHLQQIENLKNRLITNGTEEEKAKWAGLLSSTSEITPERMKKIGENAKDLSPEEQKLLSTFGFLPNLHQVKEALFLDPYLMPSLDPNLAKRAYQIQKLCTEAKQRYFHAKNFPDETYQSCLQAFYEGLEKTPPQSLQWSGEGALPDTLCNWQQQEFFMQATFHPEHSLYLAFSGQAELVQWYQRTQLKASEMVPDPDDEEGRIQATQAIQEADLRESLEKIDGRLDFGFQEPLIAPGGQCLAIFPKGHPDQTAFYYYPLGLPGSLRQYTPQANREIHSYLMSAVPPEMACCSTDENRSSDPMSFLPNATSSSESALYPYVQENPLTNLNPIEETQLYAMLFFHSSAAGVDAVMGFIQRSPHTLSQDLVQGRLLQVLCTGCLAYDFIQKYPQDANRCGEILQAAIEKAKRQKDVSSALFLLFIADHLHKLGMTTAPSFSQKECTWVLEQLKAQGKYSVRNGLYLLAMLKEKDIQTFPQEELQQLFGIWQQVRFQEYACPCRHLFELVFQNMQEKLLPAIREREDSAAILGQEELAILSSQAKKPTPLPDEIQTDPDYQKLFGSQAVLAHYEHRGRYQVFTFRCGDREFTLEQNAITHKIARISQTFQGKRYVHAKTSCLEEANLGPVFKELGIWVSVDNPQEALLFTAPLAGEKTQEQMLKNRGVLFLTLSSSKELIQIKTADGMVVCPDMDRRYTPWLSCCREENILFLRHPDSDSLDEIYFLDSKTGLVRKQEEWVPSGKERGWAWQTHGTQWLVKTFGEDYEGCMIPLIHSSGRRELKIRPHPIQPTTKEKRIKQKLTFAPPPFTDPRAAELSIAIDEKGIFHATHAGFFYLAYYSFARGDIDAAIFYLNEMQSSRAIPNPADARLLTALREELFQMPSSSTKAKAFLLKAETALSKLLREQYRTPAYQTHSWESFQQRTDRLVTFYEGCKEAKLPPELSLTEEERLELGILSEEALRSLAAKAPQASIPASLHLDLSKRAQYKSSFVSYLLLLSEPPDRQASFASLQRKMSLSPEEMLTHFWTYVRVIQTEHITPEQLSILFQKIPHAEMMNPQLVEAIEYARQTLLILSKEKSNMDLPPDSFFKDISPLEAQWLQRRGEPGPFRSLLVHTQKTRQGPLARLQELWDVLKKATHDQSVNSLRTYLDETLQTIQTEDKHLFLGTPPTPAEEGVSEEDFLDKITNPQEKETYRQALEASRGSGVPQGPLMNLFQRLHTARIPIAEHQHTARQKALITALENPPSPAGSPPFSDVHLQSLIQEQEPMQEVLLEQTSSWMQQISPSDLQNAISHLQKHPNEQATWREKYQTLTRESNPTAPVLSARNTIEAHLDLLLYQALEIRQASQECPSPTRSIEEILQGVFTGYNALCASRELAHIESTEKSLLETFPSPREHEEEIEALELQIQTIDHDLQPARDLANNLNTHVDTITSCTNQIQRLQDSINSTLINTTIEELRTKKTALQKQLQKPTTRDSIQQQIQDIDKEITALQERLQPSKQKEIQQQIETLKHQRTATEEKAIRLSRNPLCQDKGCFDMMDPGAQEYVTTVFQARGLSLPEPSRISELQQQRKALEQELQNLRQFPRDTHNVLQEEIQAVEAKLTKTSPQDTTSIAALQRKKEALLLQKQKLAIQDPMYRHEVDRMRAGIRSAGEARRQLIKDPAAIRLHGVRPLQGSLQKRVQELSTRTEELKERILQQVESTSQENHLFLLYANRDKLGDERILEEILERYQDGTLKAEPSVHQEISQFLLLSIKKQLFEKAESDATGSLQQLEELKKDVDRTLKEIVGAQQKLAVIENKADQAKLRTYIERQKTLLLDLELEWKAVSHEVLAKIHRGSDLGFFCDATGTLTEQAVHRPMLVFSYRKKIGITQEQVRIIKTLLTDPNALEELRMGLGKSSVIFPLVARLLAQQGCLPVVLFTDELIEQSRKEMDRRAYLFDFRRSPDLSQNQLADEYLTLLKVRQNGQYVITSSSRLAALENKFHEIHDNLAKKQKVYEELKSKADASPKDPQLQQAVAALEKEILELTNRSYWVAKIYQVFHEEQNARFLIDEVDEVLRITSEQNYSIGAPSQIDADTLSSSKKIFEILLKKETLAVAALHDAFLQNTQATLAPETIEQAAKEIAVALLDTEVDPQKVLYLTSRQAEVPEGFNPIGKGAYRDWLTQTLFTLCKKQQGIDYGFSENGHSVAPRKEEREKPNTQFGEEAELAGFHLLTYLQMPPSQEFFLEILPEIRQRKDSSEWGEWLRKLEKNGASDEAVYAQLQQDPSLRIGFLIFVMQNTQHIQIYRDQIRCQVQDLIAQRKVCGASGTMNRYALPSSFSRMDQEVDPRQVTGDLLMRLSLTDREGLSRPVGVFEDPMRCMEERIQDLSCKAIINIGSSIQGLTTYDIIERLRETEAGKKRQFIFIHPEHKVAYLWDIGQDKPRPFDKHKDASSINPKVCLYYFAPADIRGTDFKIPSGYGALMTGPTTTLPVLEQAIWRLRKLGTGHSVRFFVDKALAGRIAPSTSLQTQHLIEDILKKTLEEDAFMNVKAQARRPESIAISYIKPHLLSPQKELSSFDPDALNIEKMIHEAVHPLFFAHKRMQYESILSQSKEVPSVEYLSSLYEKQKQAVLDLKTRLESIPDGDRKNQMLRACDEAVEALESAKNTLLSESSFHQKHLPPTTLSQASMDSGTETETQTEQETQQEQEQTATTTSSLPRRNRKEIPTNSASIFLCQILGKLWDARADFSTDLSACFPGCGFPNSILLSNDFYAWFKQLPLQGKILGPIVLCQYNTPPTYRAILSTHSETSSLHSQFQSMSQDESIQGYTAYTATPSMEQMISYKTISPTAEVHQLFGQIKLIHGCAEEMFIQEEKDALQTWYLGLSPNEKTKLKTTLRSRSAIDSAHMLEGFESNKRTPTPPEDRPPPPTEPSLTTRSLLKDCGGGGNCAALALADQLRASTSKSLRQEASSYLQQQADRLAQDPSWVSMVADAWKTAQTDGSTIPSDIKALLALESLDETQSKQLISSYGQHIANDGVWLDKPFFAAIAEKNNVSIAILEEREETYQIAERWPQDLPISNATYFIHYNRSREQGQGYHFQSVDRTQSSALEALITRDQEKQLTHFCEECTWLRETYCKPGQEPEKGKITTSLRQNLHNLQYANPTAYAHLQTIFTHRTQRTPE